MFGVEGGESAATVERKRFSMEEAHLRWPFLTRDDAATLGNELQPVRIVGDRTGRKRPEAEADVKAWRAGKDFGP